MLKAKQSIEEEPAKIKAIKNKTDIDLFRLIQ
jgi:hypothetical protein